MSREEILSTIRSALGAPSDSQFATPPVMLHSEEVKPEQFTAALTALAGKVAAVRDARRRASLRRIGARTGGARSHRARLCCATLRSRRSPASTPNFHASLATATSETRPPISL